MLRALVLAAAASTAVFAPGLAVAQPIGTYRWQLQPYCNVMVLNVIQEGSVFRLQGTDDQCGQTGGKPAVVTGIALLGPIGWVHLGLTTMSPDGAVTEGALVRASIDLASLSGEWSDNGGQRGSFVFSPGTGTLGPRRGLVPSSFVHFVTSTNRMPVPNPGISCFSHPLTDGNPNAIILITPNLGRDSERRPPVAIPVDLVYYDSDTGLGAPLSRNVWCIVRELPAANTLLPLGTGFTIHVVNR